MEIIALIVFAYLLGSIPTGYILGKIAGVDVRQVGSGNVGATNVARAVGKWQGVLTLLADAMKGMLPAAIGLAMMLPSAAIAALSAAAFLGHLYPIFLNFRGGKGVATALGALLVIAPLAGVTVGGNLRCGGFSYPPGVVELDRRSRLGPVRALAVFTAPSDRPAGGFSCRDDRLASSRQYSAFTSRYRAAL